MGAVNEEAALRAAEEIGRETRDAFRRGQYPGLCEGAYTDECRHNPRHVLTEADKRRLTSGWWS